MMKRLATISLCLSLLFTSTVFAGTWILDGDKWKYQDQESFLTSSWLQDDDNWFYLDSNGNMVTSTTQNIDGTDYTFDSSGKLLKEITDGWNGNTYISNQFNYSITFPDGYTTYNMNGMPVDFAVHNGGKIICASHYELAANSDGSTYIDEINTTLLSNLGLKNITPQNSTVEMGGYQYNKSRVRPYQTTYLDTYWRLEGNTVISFMVLYNSDSEWVVQNILDTLKPVR